MVLTFIEPSLFISFDPQWRCLSNKSRLVICICMLAAPDSLSLELVSRLCQAEKQLKQVSLVYICTEGTSTSGLWDQFLRLPRLFTGSPSDVGAILSCPWDFFPATISDFLLKLQKYLPYPKFSHILSFSMSSCFMWSHATVCAPPVTGTKPKNVQDKPGTRDAPWVNTHELDIFS